MSEQKRKRTSPWAAMSAGLALLAFAQPAHAYMDPGSMSVIVTAILGAIAAVGYTARVYWARLKDFLARLFGRPRPEEPPRDKE